MAPVLFLNAHPTYNDMSVGISSLVEHVIRLTHGIAIAIGSTVR